jgi:hypothetical protein
LRLEDQGEGWFWDAGVIEVEVLDHVRKHSREYYRVLFAEPLEVHEGDVPGELGEPAAPDGIAATCTGAWLSPRWVGHEVSRDHDISALLWMVRDVRQAVKPPRDVQYSARVRCRRAD